MKWKSLSHVQIFLIYSPWNFPGQNTGVGRHSLLQEIFPTQGLKPPALQEDSLPAELPGNPPWKIFNDFLCSGFSSKILAYNTRIIHWSCISASDNLMVEGIAELGHNSLLSWFQVSVQKYNHRKLRKMLPFTEEKSTHYSTNSIHAYFFQISKE